MAGKKKKSYQEKSKPGYMILYVLAVIFLLVLLVMMYRNWQTKRRGYEALVQQAAATEADYDIETRKLLNNELPLDDDSEEEQQNPQG